MYHDVSLSSVAAPVVVVDLYVYCLGYCRWCGLRLDFLASYLCAGGVGVVVWNDLLAACCFRV